ncbi:hypothetical protein GCM10008024_21420 [Allgaiera indica]|uniref:Uncharacterized protein n=1 Tax=Allgaiera indica TaxID=765699 RepID=A0AAN4ZZI7_9RHOB|nr:hypothetical protein GCM10008024_21420 [Allgaiera indica]SDX31273.1 hypothetical protein SAMN05444006_113114 [Allgaiera indica]
MWFDVQTALTEIESGQPTRPARVANVAGVATLPARKPARKAAEAGPHVANVASAATPASLPRGVSVTGSPCTWTGRVVSLDEWRRLSEWERSGPDGRMFCGACRVWVLPGGCPHCEGGMA